MGRTHGNTWPSWSEPFLVVLGSMSIVAAHAMQAPVLLVALFGFGLALLAAILDDGAIAS